MTGSILTCLIEISEGNFYVEVKNNRYRIHPTKNTTKGPLPLPLRTQYRVQNETQIGKNQKILRNNLGK